MRNKDSSFAEHGATGAVTKALSLKVTPKHDIVGTENEIKSQIFCATLQARTLPEEHERAPVDIIVTLDVSHSMEMRSKLDLCKSTLKLLLRVLGPNDRFGLVTYATDARVDFPPLSMTESNKQVCLRKIQDLVVRGSTDISSAVGLAVQAMRFIVRPNEVQNIFLLTDGEANEGIADHQGLVEFTKNCFTFNNNDKQASTSPIGMSCFGYGENHNAKLLEDMASTVLGSYYFVQDDSDVGSAFGDALGGILSVVAQSTVLTIKVPDDAAELGVEIVKVHHAEAIQREPARVYTVTVGDFYAEESRDVLVEVKLSKPAGGGEDNNADTIRHLVVSAAFTDTMLRVPDQIGPIDGYVYRLVGSTDCSAPSPHVMTQFMRVKAVEAYKESSHLVHEEHNYSGARDKLGEIAAELAECKALNEALQVDELFAQLERDTDELAKIMSEEQFRGMGSMKMSNTAQKYTLQRCMASKTSDYCVFRGSEKQRMAERLSRDPNTMSPQAMMQAADGGGFVPGIGGSNNSIGGSLPSFFPPQQAPPSNNSSSNQGQQAGEEGDERLTEEEMIDEAIRQSMTEEEMVAEAIRRSLFYATLRF